MTASSLSPQRTPLRVPGYQIEQTSHRIETRTNAEFSAEENNGDTKQPCSQAPQRPLSIGEAWRLLRNVQVLNKIGQGATAAVFAVLNSMQQLVAYKIARVSAANQFAAIRKAIGLIWGAAEAARYLLPAFVDLCRDERYYFVATPLLDDLHGRPYDLSNYRPATLWAWLTTLPRINGTLSRQDAHTFIGYVYAALEGLHFLHRNGFIYNDVHPGNIGLFQGRPVLIDWSAITFIRQEVHEICRWYAPPEGAESTPANDVYGALKVVLQGLTGVHPATIQPFVIHEICQKHFKGLAGAVMTHIALKGLHPDPSKRYQSASELMQDLKHAQSLLSEDIGE